MKTQEREEWKPIEILRGEYEVSSHGRVRRKKPCGGAMVGRIMAQRPCQRGYPTVQIVLGTKNKRLLVHRLIAIAFIPNPLGYPYINHINGIKADIRIENLEWVTHRENVAHAASLNLTAFGSRNGQAKLTEEVVALCRKERAENGTTYKVLAKRNGVSDVAMRKAIVGKNWRRVKESVA